MRSIRAMRQVRTQNLVREVREQVGESDGTCRSGIEAQPVDATTAVAVKALLRGVR